jgi:nitrite reductase (NO-forming)
MNAPSSHDTGGVPTVDAEPAAAPALRRDKFLMLCALSALGAMLVSIAAVGVAITTKSSAGSRVATAAPQTVEVELGDFYIKPAKLDVAAGTPVTFKVTNHGKMTHDFVVSGHKTSMLQPGKSGTVTATIDSATQAYCSVPGHRAAGMTMDITTGGGTAASATASDASSTAMDHSMMNSASSGSTSGSGTDATIDPNAQPASSWKPRDATLAPAPGGTVHDVTFHATEKVMEVAPGVSQQMWTFNDQVPGPVLRGKVGDVFNVTLVNDGKVSHSIDFHASQTAMDRNMRTLAPGQRLTYTFRAEHSGIWMYHCGTAPVLHHIGNGMYGAVIIDPPDLPRVDKELLMVQSELYLGPEGQPGDYTKMLDGKPDAVVFNGYYNQYKFAPIHVTAGERIRVWVLNVGPNETSSFHIVGTIFDGVYKEGAWLLRPGVSTGGSQALDLTPAQGGFVELTIPEDGSYAAVSHKFNDAARGATGVLLAGNGTPMAH